MHSVFNHFLRASFFPIRADIQKSRRHLKRKAFDVKYRHENNGSVFSIGGTVDWGSAQRSAGLGADIVWEEDRPLN